MGAGSLHSTQRKDTNPSEPVRRAGYVGDPPGVYNTTIPVFMKMIAAPMAGPPNLNKRGGFGGAQLVRAAGAGLLDLLLPPYCLGCGDRVGSARSLLCFCCVRSADRADAEDVRERIDRLPEVRSAVDHAFALWNFDKGGFLQALHQALKYGNRPRYGMYLGRMLGCAFEQATRRRPSPDVIVPVPLHPRRRCERGYNQSAWLARGLAEVLEVPLDERALVRVRSTLSQTRLTREERWCNLRGAFASPAVTSLAGARVLLVDDVITTGATAGAAAAVLRASGAQAVDLALLALART